MNDSVQDRAISLANALAIPNFFIWVPSYCNMLFKGIKHFICVRTNIDTFVRAPFVNYIMPGEISQMTMQPMSSSCGSWLWSEGGCYDVYMGFFLCKDSGSVTVLFCPLYVLVMSYIVARH